jgi:hypothetical protein
MKKPKVSLNGAAIKNFFINNGEKLVLGLVVLLLLNFAYGAITAKPLDPGKANEIKTASNDAQARIEEVPWGVFSRDKPEYIPRDFRQEAKVNNDPLEKALALITETPYQPKIFPELIKRADPKILPAMELTGTATVVLVPYLREIAAGVNPVAPGGPLPPRMAREEERKAAKKAQKGAGKTGTPGGEMGGELGAGGPPQGYAGRRRGEEEAPATAAATDRSIAGAQLPGVRAANAELKPKAMAIVTALVPFEEQYKEYKKRFEDALGKGLMPVSGAGIDQYTPNYVYFFIQRAEVKDDRDQNLVWKDIKIDVARKELALMVPTNPQTEPPIDPLYSFLGGSTVATAAGSINDWTGFFEWPLPPVILRNWGFEVTHPKVPFAKPIAMETMQEQEFHEPGKEPAGAIGPDGRPLPPQPGAVPPRGGMHGGGFAGQRGMGGEFGGGRGGMMPGPGRNFGGEGGAGMSTVPQVPHKLFRYVDLTCLPGKLYRYRVMLMVVNPNARLPAAYLEDPESANRPYVKSEWSAPSSVIEIPMNGQALAVAAGATAGNEPEAQISIQQIVQWKREVKKGAPAPPAGDPLAGGAMLNTEPTEGWVEVLQEKLKVPLGGLVYFPNHAVEKVLDMAVEIEKKKVEGLTLSCQNRSEAMLLDMRSDDPLGVAKSKGPTELLYFSPDGRLFSTHSGVDRLVSDDYKDRTFVPANITGGGYGPGGAGGEFGPPRGGGMRFGPGRE